MSNTLVETDNEFNPVSSLKLAIEEAQKAFAGEAERLDLKTEEDVVALVNEVRKTIQEAEGAASA